MLSLAIQPKLLQTEIDLRGAASPNSISAYDLYLQATAHYHAMKREDVGEALRLLYRALEIDPSLQPRGVIGRRLSHPQPHAKIGY